MSKEKRSLKRGRKVLRDTAMTERLSFRLTPREMQILRDAAWRYDQSPSNLVRFALEVVGLIPSW